MCKFGCDELFEKGIVYVDKEGLFDKKHTGNSYIDKYLEKISGQCDYFNSKTESYFRWHSNFHHSTAKD